ncbi:bifunctional phosphopantothenoylcysteine decarboxylase/phosphopantothenate--cysteine ligase CoaBC [Campylobacter fetus]|uniref:bifunctional phosphopantothenoylcysteine decarboxylase/phosphopantothenate--cysteine ligase CoaBC n=1 Tax=Campylobacter fetus TaxID=196 RepID=UPI0003C283D9|nr:bifunctional phosphopantothenoylcysteine decarboxylase/phosphopantothenate--cysteine ligase CoaBC [Campylobacter fetus]AGZ81609.1 phosphopantothenoylcysteine decarboxylase/phosphopantothenate--cysteine ligase [Campylobacter fetus subsp. testudinum 03-427]AJB45350.1 phosphopantothenate synthase [Campylobacter fetus subsp. testudinum]ALV64769.1 phosphopantothenoylcysteine decarboxylase/phosphopantothenate--cysteine ligase [Campylobacter fetus subsp. testudinum Sp3]EAI4321414.1 bifunctional pho
MKNKNILLAVCGSVSFYKAYEILSLLKKEGANVRVMLSDGALKFTNLISFEALCDKQVLSSISENWQSGINHINYSKNDLIIIAPASANTINKISCGIADNVFLETILASTCPKLLAPAANHNMLENFTTKKSLEILSQNGYEICEPVSKTLACKDFGKGALADPKTIVEAAKRVLGKDEFYIGKKIIITGGPTTEKIDDVRGITNFSSGKMAKALADAFYYLGSEVIFISSKEFETPYKFIKFENSNELLEILNLQKVTDNDLLIMCAAISDYVPKNKFNGKMKKNENGINLELILNKDILKNINLKCKKIGFKMEMDKKTAVQNAKNMLIDKNLNAVCLNILDENIKFGSDETYIDFITKESYKTTEFTDKLSAAKQIAEFIKTL